MFWEGVMMETIILQREIKEFNLIVCIGLQGVKTLDMLSNFE